MKRVAAYPAHLRHRLGFGVQSPWAFYLVRFVLREKWPFYAFKELAALRRKAPSNAAACSRKHGERLFRLANWMKPRHVVVVGDDCPVMSAIYLGAYSSRVSVVCLCRHESSVGRNLLESRGVEYRCGDVMTLLATECHDKVIECLLISVEEGAWDIFDYAADHVDDDSMFIVERLDTPQGKALWQNIKDDNRARATFNLGRSGLVFFNSKRSRMNYNL